MKSKMKAGSTITQNKWKAGRLHTEQRKAGSTIHTEQKEDKKIAHRAIGKQEGYIQSKRKADRKQK